MGEINVLNVKRRETAYLLGDVNLFVVAVSTASTSTLLLSFIALSKLL